MAGTNDPGDRTGGSGPRHPQVLDLSASEVEPRKTGAANEMSGVKSDVKGSDETPDTGSKTTADDGAAGSSSDAKLANPNDTKSAGAKDPAAAARSAGDTSSGAKPGESAKAAAAGGATRASSPVPSVGAKADPVPPTPDKTGTADTAGATTTAASTSASDEPGSAARGAEPATSQTPPQAARGGVGVGGVLLAAVVGGAIVLGGGYLALSSGAIRLPAGPQLPGVQTAGEDVQARLAALEDRIDGVASAASATASDDVDGLKSDVEALKSQIGAVDTGLPDKVAALETRVADLANAEPAVAPADIEALRGDVSRAADAAAQASTAAGNAATTAGSATAAIGPLQQSVQALQSSETALQATVTDMTGRVAELEKIVGGTGPREVAALALSTAVLDNALRNGQPFGPALAAVKTRLEDPALVAPLEPYAETGLPTQRELTAAYPDVEASVRSTLRGNAQAEGFVAGLLANAESLVKVRRTDAPEGGGVYATLDAIRADLARGDLAAASTAWTNLPAAAQDASQAWHDQLAARVAAERLVNQVTKEVLASLADTPTGQQITPVGPTTPGN